MTSLFDMDPIFKNPPISKKHLSSNEAIASSLQILIGQSFPLTGKSRTDGSNIRKLVARTLLKAGVPQPSQQANYEIVPPKGKGVPKILLEYTDTYIVTSGSSYNLQVWNRNPSSKSVQIQFKNGDTLCSDEVRFVLVKVNQSTEKIDAVIVLSPEYIERKFGVFGKPTIKQQLIISNTARNIVLGKPDRILFYNDLVNIGNVNNSRNLGSLSIHDEPSSSSLLPLKEIQRFVKNNLIGHTIPAAATKTRGQKLEEEFALALGYKLRAGELLAGGFPDIRNQALEVKIQDSPTVDLGMYSPEFLADIPSCSGFNTETVRYFIALTDPNTGLIEGAVLCPGVCLGNHFTYVGDKSYKCQRSIPMSFFAKFTGKSVFNP